MDTLSAIILLQDYVHAAMFGRPTGNRVALVLRDAAPDRQALHEGDDAALHVGRADGREDRVGHGSQHRWVGNRTNRPLLSANRLV